MPTCGGAAWQHREGIGCLLRARGEARHDGSGRSDLAQQAAHALRGLLPQAAHTLRGLLQQVGHCGATATRARSTTALPVQVGVVDVNGKEDGVEACADYSGLKTNIMT